MFIPSEGVYYDLLINQVGAVKTSTRDLIEYAFGKKVIIVSPTSFLAYLQTVMQGLRALQIEEQAKDIQKRVGDLGRHLGNFDVFFKKLGNALGTVVGHFNTAHKELGKIDTDVIKIADVHSGIEPLTLERPQTEE
jgi:DNA recombination protein RmuC